MEDTEPKSVPTASDNMLQKSAHSKLNGVASKSKRTRSKSESAHQSHQTLKELSGLDIKSAKDKAHDRRPKNLKGSGKPKKEGGGGKGTWGKNGQVYEEESFTDPDDPNYDSDTNKGEDMVLQEVKPDLTSAEFDKVATPIFQEYYDHGLTAEVSASLQELNITHLKHRIVYLTILIAMEKKGAQREQTSVLLSDLYGYRVLCEQDFELGFQASMNALDDMMLDTPDANQVLGRFMARCVADDCLNPCYIKEHLQHPTESARVALETANRLLLQKHGIVRLDTVWGFGGGIRPVKLLIKEIILLIKEFLSSRDFKEAERCVMDLDVPHFHHEIVFEAIQIGLEAGSNVGLQNITDLLKHLHDAAMITDDQMNSGFERVYATMDDIVLDIPRAYKHLENLLEQCCRAGVVSLEMRQKAPHRGRKRYVSEGDFGMSSRPLVP